MSRNDPLRVAAALGSFALLAAACAYTGPPVPVAGTDQGIAALTGEWSGSYDFRDRGRSGSILFRLETQQDTAHGDVLMLLDDQGGGFQAGSDPWQVAPGPGSILLDIAFVRTAESRVAGALEPYEDPVCRCMLSTRFEGRIQGDRIVGTFTARTPADDELHGDWAVDRVEPR